MNTSLVFETVWKDVVGYEGLYQVSNEGQIKNLRTGQFIKSRIMTSRGGYVYINLCKNGEEKTHRLHRIVAQAFHPNPYNKPEVNHIDFNRSNNMSSNLEWCSSQENKRHSINNYTRGLNHSRSVILIHTEMGVFASLREAAGMCGVSPQFMCDMLSGRVKNKTAFLYV